MVKQLLLRAIRLFQATRAMRAPACRFYPSCSDYTYVAVERHGLVAGILLGAGRLLRCHPFHSGGVEFVPDELSWWHRCDVILHPSRR